MFQQYLPITNVDCDENVVEAISHVFPAKVFIALREQELVMLPRQNCNAEYVAAQPEYAEHNYQHRQQH